jgi:hypothetical protein
MDSWSTNAWPSQGTNLTLLTSHTDAANLLFGILPDARMPNLTGDVTTTEGAVATTIAANAVALGTDTTGNYAAGDAEAGAALTGDSATSFFASGTLENTLLDADLQTWAGITPGTGVGAALAINVNTAGAFLTNGALPAISGAALTSLSAANITAGGTLPVLATTTQTAGDATTNLATTAFVNTAKVNATNAASLYTVIAGVTNSAGGVLFGTITGNGSGITNLAYFVTNQVAAASISNNLSLNIGAGTLTATTFSGSGASLTAVNAATVTVVDGTDATSFVGIFDSATGSLAAKTDAALLYDADNGLLNARSYESATNQWATNTLITLGTNTCTATLTANTGGGITGILNAGTTTERFAQLFIKATGDVVFTNPVAFYCNDYADTRTITNGNTAWISVDVIPGVATNLAIVQFK